MIAVVPPLSVVRLASGVPPTTPLNVVAPELFTTSAPGPSSVVLNVTPPPPALRVVVCAAGIIVALSETTPPVVMSPASTVFPAVCVNPPVNAVESPVASPICRVPVLLKLETAPVVSPFRKDTLPAAPASVTPFVRLRCPLNVVLVDVVTESEFAC